ncbi:hypothetical protein PQR46_41530, partial [Paraburkholderia sediminicola]|uniref:hypothetical protein n=1 Tax=Paraburkholderia sediminicola TaxID=458836 RepID=UPI0038B7F84B
QGKAKAMGTWTKAPRRQSKSSKAQRPRQPAKQNPSQEKEKIRTYAADQSEPRPAYHRPTQKAH